MSIGYRFKDTFIISPAEDYCNKYRNLKDSLESKIKKIEEAVNYIKNTSDKFYERTMQQGNAGDSYGKVIDELFRKGDIAQTNKNNLIENFEIILESLKLKYATANTRYNRLESLCREEDQREEEYTAVEVQNVISNIF